MDICRAFNRHRVRYLIIGGDAAIYYGAEYVSVDYDLWISTQESNLKKTIKALIDLRYCDDSDFSHGGRMYRRWQTFTLGMIIRFEKKGEKPLDILTRVKYKKFDSCYQRVNTAINSDGVAMPWISKKDLKFLKKTAGREKDLLALEQIAEKEKQDRTGGR